MNKELLDYFNGDELASSVWKNKYALEGEITPDDMHKRLAKEFARIEYKRVQEEEDSIGIIKWNELSYYGRHRDPLNFDTIYGMFEGFKQLIPQGSIMSQLGSPAIGSLSNCFVVGQPVDSYGGIFQKEQEMIQLMKRRGGVGIDISTLRPEGVATTNAAKSSTGAVSFMHRFSNGTREVAQKGRRGALMISIDIKHPDVLQFIKIKRDLSQVTGANISIKLNDEFMRAVENDEDYILRFPCDLSPKIAYPDPKDLEYNVLLKLISDVKEKEGFIKKIKAKEYWDEIIKSAHNVAEPGLMFWSTMLEYSPDSVYPKFLQITTNPCSEIGMQAYDACRLIAHNIFSYVLNPYTSECAFDFDQFYKVNYEAMRLSDDLIDLELEHIDRIIAKIKADPEEDDIKYTELKLWEKVRDMAMSSRRTGLGMTALGDTIAALGMAYDSDEALVFVEKLMETKMRSELDCTIDLAIIRGTFEGHDSTLEFDEIRSISEPLKGKNDFYKFVAKNFPEQAQRMFKHGRRNVSWSTMAPTGSLSILAKLIKFSNVSSGMEPMFSPFYMRRKKVTKGDGSRVDFTDVSGDTWQEYPVMMAGFKEWYEVFRTQHPAFTDKEAENLSPLDLEYLKGHSPYYGSTANDINWIKRVEMQSIIQKYTTHSISSTINLPENVSEAEVSEIYLESWKQGLKGITVYRDGSRSGVLVDNTKEVKSEFEYRDAIKRPKTLNAELHVIGSSLDKFTIIVGLLNGKPYEVFGYNYALEHGKARKGKLAKQTRGKYLFDKEEISAEMSDEQAAITRLASTSLRHGTDIKFIVEQLNKCEGDLFSFTKALARVLKKYIPEGAKSTVTCQDCGSTNVIFQEGCSSCQDCGSSKCG